MIPAVNTVAVDWITDRVLQALVQGEPAPPRALTFLLRRYVETGREDLSDALGPALARALDRCSSDPEAGPTSTSGVESAEWLMLFVEAAGFSEDERFCGAAAGLVAALVERWPSHGNVVPALRSVEACLSATRLERTNANAAAAIDELERIIGAAYLPGDGLARTTNGRMRELGDLLDHAAAASALLTAYAIAGRLPYSMLAEELMQFARRSWWDDARGGFHAGTANVERSTANVERRTSNDLFIANCEAARVLCRLAALHRDQEYRQAAVIAEQSDYADDAARTLESLLDEYRVMELEATIYGLALGEIQLLR